MNNHLNALIRDIPIPKRMENLPISPKGFPVPWFVNIDDAGIPNFTVIHPGRIAQAYTQHKCWLCGEVMGVYRCFVSGPMCVVNRTSAEPPSHLECATYAVRACPFLINPAAKRNANALPEEHLAPPGEMLTRNPGVTALYVTKKYKPWNAGNGILFEMGEPERVEWWSRGRQATRAEVDAAIDSGLPELYKRCDMDRDPKEARIELGKYLARARTLLPQHAL